MKIKIYTTLAILFIASLLLWGYYSQKGDAENLPTDNIAKQEQIDLHFGHQGVEDFNRQQSAMDMHPVGMGFMDLRWRPPNLGKVRIVTDYTDLEIDHIFKVGGIALNQGSDDGIQDITVQGSLHHDEYTTQQAAYNAYVELMTQLNEKGWEQYFAPFIAPIDKRDNLKYLADPLFGRISDPSTILTFDEWIENSESMQLNLYNHEIQLSIMIKRRFQDKKIDREQYMISYSFITQRYFIRNLISGSHKMDAKEIESAFKQNQLDDRKFRHNDEIRMKEKGYRIDESYVDPDIWQYVQ